MMLEPQREVTTLGFCLTLERSDGTGVALTSHDHPVTINGIVHDPCGGLLPQSFQQGDAHAPAADLDTSLDTGMLSEGDLSAGRWDGARVTMSASPWSMPEQVTHLATGYFGDVAAGDGGFRVQVAGTEQRLWRKVCPTLSPDCRATLGDKQCRVDLSALKRRARIVQVRGSWLDLDVEVGNAYLLGSIRFMTGKLCGIRQVVVGTEGNSVRIRESLDLTSSVGETIELLQGCDKQPGTCRNRFNNTINFRGEPFVPGTDFLMRYPGA